MCPWRVCLAPCLFLSLILRLLAPTKWAAFNTPFSAPQYLHLSIDPDTSDHGLSPSTLWALSPWIWLALLCFTVFQMMACSLTSTGSESTRVIESTFSCGEPPWHLGSSVLDLSFFAAFHTHRWSHHTDLRAPSQMVYQAETASRQRKSKLSVSEQ